MIQRGFTLIELMTVVTAIGILSSVAIPVYQDYSIRVSVSEGLYLAKPAKLSIAETWHSAGVVPQANSTAGLPLSTSIVGNYVSSVAVGANGAITITYNNIPEIQGSTLLLVPTTIPGAVMWDCRSNTAGSVPDIYRPVQCR